MRNGHAEVRTSGTKENSVRSDRDDLWQLNLLSQHYAKLKLSVSHRKRIYRTFSVFLTALALLHRDQFDEHWKPKKASRQGLVVVDTRYLR